MRGEGSIRLKLMSASCALAVIFYRVAVALSPRYYSGEAPGRSPGLWKTRVLTLILRPDQILAGFFPALPFPRLPLRAAAFGGPAAAKVLQIQALCPATLCSLGDSFHAVPGDARNRRTGRNRHRHPLRLPPGGRLPRMCIQGPPQHCKLPRHHSSCERRGAISLGPACRWRASFLQSLRGPR